MKAQVLHRRGLSYTLWCCVLAVPLLSSKCQEQVQRSQPDQIAYSVNQVKSGSITGKNISTIAQAGAAQEVLPALEGQFSRTNDPAMQGVVATALVRLGDSDSKYWDFILQQATSAVESDMPDPHHDADGQSTGGKLSTQFVEWAQFHHIDLNTAIQAWAYELPGAVLRLGMVNDRRSIPILRRALESQNFVIVMMGSEGLAQLRDTESIPAIITACKRFDKDTASAIAEGSLVYFDDSQAQAAVDSFVPQDRARLRRQSVAQGKRPLGE